MIGTRSRIVAQRLSALPVRTATVPSMDELDAIFGMDELDAIFGMDELNTIFGSMEVLLPYGGEVRLLDLPAALCERTEQKLRAELPFVRVTRVRHVQCARAVRDFYALGVATDPCFVAPPDDADASPLIALPASAHMGWLPCGGGGMDVYASARAALAHCPAWLPQELLLCAVIPVGEGHVLARLLVTLEEYDSVLLDSLLL